MTFQSAGVTLKMKPRKSKSNQLLTLYLQYIYASLNKIELPVQRTECQKG